MQITTEDPGSWFAYYLYHWGRGESLQVGNARRIGPILWRDAEDYLDRLDQSVPYKARSEIILQALHKLREQCQTEDRKRLTLLNQISKNAILEQVLLKAKQWMAAECCAFVKNADPNTERWLPFRSWAELLTAEDTIVTFNYDLVLETLKAVGARPNPMRHSAHIPLNVVLPNDYSNENAANLYKLHGSVNWQRSKDGKYSESNDSEFAMKAQLAEMGIATPGDHKQKTVSELNSLWRQATESIENANEIVFVGYRFPETDNEAKIKILSSLAKLRNKGQQCGVAIVLGPDVNSIESKRLMGLLNHVGFSPDRNCGQVPLYADDFFSLNWVTRNRKAII